MLSPSQLPVTQHLSFFLLRQSKNKINHRSQSKKLIYGHAGRGFIMFNQLQLGMRLIVIRKFRRQLHKMMLYKGVRLNGVQRSQMTGEQVRASQNCPPVY